MHRKESELGSSVPTIVSYALIITVIVIFAGASGCSKSSRQVVASTTAVSAALPQTALESSAPPQQSAEVRKISTTKAPLAKPSAPRPITYRSRDYGVSFTYPWQYSFLSARALSLMGDESREPRSDGHESQFTLARIEVPKSFYPATNFDSGYFTLSLDPEIGQQECTAAFVPAKDADVKTESINGVDFRWTESESGGHGESSRVRNYMAFANGTCYEIELGVITKNDRGLAANVNSDHVFNRLETILHTVKITAAQKPVTEEAQSESANPPSLHK